MKSTDNELCQRAQTVGRRVGTIMSIATIRFVTLWLTLCLLPTLKAQLILYEGFDYQPGSFLEGNGQVGLSWGTNLWLKHYATSDWLVYSNSLSYPSILTSGGYVAETNNAHGADYERKFAPYPFQDGTSVWFSFLVKVTQGTSWDLFFTSAGLNDNQFGVMACYPEYSIRARLGVGYNGSDETIYLGQNITRLIVGRYRYSESGLEQLDLWVDPDIYSEPPTGGSSSSNHIVHLRQHDLQPNQIDSVLLEDRSIGSLAFDELRVGEGWKDAVVPRVDAVIIDRIIASEGQITLDLSRLTPGATTTVQRATQLFGPESWEDVDTFIPSVRSTNWVQVPANAGKGFFRVRVD